MEFDKERFLAEIENAEKQTEENRAQFSEVSKKEDEQQASLNGLVSQNASIKVPFFYLSFIYL